MEDMAWVLYALLGTQVALLVLIAWIGGIVRLIGFHAYEANVTLGATLVGVEDELKAIRRLLEVQTRYFVED